PRLRLVHRVDHRRGSRRVRRGRPMGAGRDPGLQRQRPAVRPRRRVHRHRQLMLPPLAQVDDLETWMHVEISGSSTSRAAAILAAASTLVRQHTGRVWVDADGELTDDATDDPVRFDAVQQVVVIVAERVYKNPNGSTQQTTGPFGHSIADWAALGLALRAEEKEMLGGTSGGIPGL